MINRHKRAFTFNAKVWKYKTTGGWHFVTLPHALATKIKRTFGSSEGAWGRLDVNATLGKTHWDTAIWYDSKHKSYLLPLKAEIRKRENIVADALVSIKIKLRTSCDASIVGIISNRSSVRC